MLKGKVVVITGANTGIGLQSAVQLAALCAHVVLACRRPLAAEQAATLIRKEVAGSSVECMQVDVGSMYSVKAFAEILLAKHPKIDILINNAGVSGAGIVPGSVSLDGFNNVFAINYLGHFYLTHLLLPALQAAAPSRVVNVSSSMHRLASLKSLKTMDRKGAYSASKLANVLHGYELHRRYAGRGVSCVVVSPGAVDSDIWRHEKSCIERVNLWIMRRVFLSTQQGCATTVLGATSSAPEPGELCYLVPYRMSSCCPILTELCGPFAGPREARSSAASYNLVAARELWQDSLRWVEEALNQKQ